MGPQNHKENPS